MTRRSDFKVGCYVKKLNLVGKNSLRLCIQKKNQSFIPHLEQYFPLAGSSHIGQTLILNPVRLNLISLRKGRKIIGKKKK